MPAASTTVLSVQVLDFEDIGLLIQHRRLVCDSCSSGQRFAFGFLQIPPRDEHPCRSANRSPCRAGRGLAPPSGCALPGAPKKTPRKRGVPEAMQLASVAEKEPRVQLVSTQIATPVSRGSRRKL